MVEDCPGLIDRRISSPDWRTLSVAPKKLRQHRRPRSGRRG